jgi:hypothetical protein
MENQCSDPVFTSRGDVSTIVGLLSLVIVGITIVENVSPDLGHGPQDQIDAWVPILALGLHV